MNAKNTCAGNPGNNLPGDFYCSCCPPHSLLACGTSGVSRVGVALWKGRTYEALLQGMIILAGVFSILLLLGLKQSGRTPP